MSGWKTIKIGDCTATNTNCISKEYSHKEILYLDTGSITCNKVEQLQSFSLTQAPSRAKRLVREDDIIYSTVRPNQLHYGYVKTPPENLVVSTGFVVITCDQTKIFPKYLYYYLTQKQSTEYLHSIAEASTTAYPSLKPTDIEALEIDLPPLPEQKAIAGVLSSLDDKIDLLHRQNKTLEAMAETLFRQWFIEEAEDDWEEGKLGDMVNFLSGYSFKSNSFLPFGTYKIVTIKAVQDGYLELKNASQINIPPNNMPEHCYLNIGDILLSLTGNVGRCCLIDDKYLLLNQRVAKLQPTNTIYYPYIYFFFRQKSTRLMLEELAKGTAQLNLSPVETSNMIIDFPPLQLLSDFHAIANPILKNIIFNKQLIKHTETLRDTLLPKLMSGEVRVEYQE